MKRTTRWLFTLLAIGAVLGACSKTDDTVATGSSTSQATTATTASSGASGTTAKPSGDSAAVEVKTTTGALGTYLVDGEGKTLYLYTKDTTPGKSVCEGPCIAAWPALKGTAKAGSDVDAAALGTATLPDGTTMVAYHDVPLYYFKADAKAGDTKGQAVGGVWYVVGTDGKAIMTKAAPAAAGGGY
jgi:predicted lipoprotein with Yx(FWY)xxD motif